MYLEWLKKRRMWEEFDMGDGPVDQFKFSPDDSDFADDHDHVQEELFKAVMSKYPEETTEFFNNIAARGDEEIANLLRKLQKNQAGEMKEPQHPTEGDEVVPSTADSGYGGGEGGED